MPHLISALPVFVAFSLLSGCGSGSGNGGTDGKKTDGKQTVVSKAMQGIWIDRDEVQELRSTGEALYCYEPGTFVVEAILIDSSGAMYAYSPKAENSGKIGDIGADGMVTMKPDPMRITVSGDVLRLANASDPDISKDYLRSNEDEAIQFFAAKRDLCESLH